MISAETINVCFKGKLEILQNIIKNHSKDISHFTQLYQSGNQDQYIEDTTNYLDYLKQALLFESPSLFFDYILSIQRRLKGLKISSSYAIQSLLYLKEELLQHFTAELLEKSRRLIDTAIEQFKIPSIPLKSYLIPTNSHFQLAKKYMKNLMEGNRTQATEIIHKSVKSGIPIRELYLYVFQPVQYEVGSLWQNNSITVAEEHYCTATTQSIMAQLYPYIFKGKKEEKTLVAGCVGENLHELGIRMIADFFEIEKWDTYYLGSNVPDESLIKILVDKKPQLFALSVTLPLQLEKTWHLIQKIRDKKFLNQMKILVGGYAFNIDQELWKKVNADGYAKNAEEAIKIVDQLMI